MSTYLVKAVVKLTEASDHPSKWFPQTISNVLEAGEGSLITMYEPVGEFTYEITVLLVASTSPDTWFAQAVETSLTPDETLLGIITLDVPDEDTQAHTEAIAGKMVSLKLG
jgi:hypothetical protein